MNRTGLYIPHKWQNAWQKYVALKLHPHVADIKDSDGCNIRVWARSDDWSRPWFATLRWMPWILHHNFPRGMLAPWPLDLLGTNKCKLQSFSYVELTKNNRETWHCKRNKKNTNGTSSPNTGASAIISSANSGPYDTPSFCFWNCFSAHLGNSQQVHKKQLKGKEPPAALPFDAWMPEMAPKSYVFLLKTYSVTISFFFRGCSDHDAPCNSRVRLQYRVYIAP